MRSPRWTRQAAWSRDSASDRRNLLRGERVPPPLDRVEIVVDEVPAVRETEVVKESVLNRGTDIVLGSREQLDHGRRHEVRGAVTKDLQGRLGGGWEWSAGFSGVVDDLIWHEMPILRSRPGTLRFGEVRASAGEARHPRGDVLACLTQLRQLRLGVEGLRREIESELAQHRYRPRRCSTRLVAQTLVPLWIDGAALDAAVLRRWLVHRFTQLERARSDATWKIVQNALPTYPGLDVHSGGVYAAPLTVCQLSGCVCLRARRDAFGTRRAVDNVDNSVL